MIGTYAYMAHFEDLFWIRTWSKSDAAYIYCKNHTLPVLSV